MSFSAWLFEWVLFGIMIVLGALQLLVILGFALTLPLYWAWSAQGDSAWGQLACAVLLEATFITLVVLAVLALASMGRWVAFDRRRGVLRISRRPFGWRRSPRVVESRPLQEVAAVQLVYGGLFTEVLGQSPYDERSPPVTKQYDWYEFNLVFRAPAGSRRNIASGRDWLWMREAGREVAEFLGVPLIDQLYHGPYQQGRRGNC